MEASMFVSSGNMEVNLVLLTKETDAQLVFTVLSLHVGKKPAYIIPKLDNNTGFQLVRK